MIVGFNHNFRHKGGLYHVQTEDGGLKSPNIVTLLYSGGTILASQKTSYADITKVDNLNQVVEDLMKEQHKEMLRRLKDGEFDDRLQGHRSIVNPAIESGPSEKKEAPIPTAAAVEQRSARPASGVPVVSAAEEKPDVAQAVSRPKPTTVAPAKPSAEPVRVEPPAEITPPAPPVRKADPEPPAENIELGLDDIILSYLVGDDDK